ncbi:hypothetical protein BDR06DRAFT_974935 [Suillus hirtellus]|nr:hypothetical protein BDR06DRAFT_974935 [Suillus hirtellus]
MLEDGNKGSAGLGRARVLQIDRPAEEQRLVNMFKQVDMSKNFYLSYSYDITSTLQNNLNKPKRFNGTRWPFNDRYVWNFHMIAAPLKDSPATGVRRPWLSTTDTWTCGPSHLCNAYCPSVAPLCWSSIFDPAVLMKSLEVLQRMTDK